MDRAPGAPLAAARRWGRWNSEHVHWYLRGWPLDSESVHWDSGGSEAPQEGPPAGSVTSPQAQSEDEESMDEGMPKPMALPYELMYPVQAAAFVPATAEEIEEARRAVAAGDVEGATLGRTDYGEAPPPPTFPPPVGIAPPGRPPRVATLPDVPPPPPGRPPPGRVLPSPPEGAIPPGARARPLASVPEHVPVKAAPAPLGQLVGGTPTPPHAPWVMPSKGPPLDYYPPDGRHTPIRMYEDVYVPTQRDIENHLRLHGLPASPPVRAPPRAEQDDEEAREAELQAEVEAEVQRRAEERVLEMLDPSGDLQRGLLEGDPWQEAPAPGPLAWDPEEEEEPRGGRSEGPRGGP